MAVGHTDSVVLDTREVSRVSDLFECLVLLDLFEQRLTGEHAGRHAHITFLGNLPDVFPDAFERHVTGVECLGHVPICWEDG
jgi:hypothetical protein